MTTTTETLTSILAHHFGTEVVGKTEEALSDFARSRGLIYACEACGTIGGIDPDAPLGNYANVEEARVATRDHAGSDAFECCGDGTTFIF